MKASFRNLNTLRLKYVFLIILLGTLLYYYKKNRIQIDPRIYNTNFNYTDAEIRRDLWKNYLKDNGLSANPIGEFSQDDGRTLIMNMMKYIVSICNYNNIDYFINGGTLFGSWIHHAMIPWDHAIDLVVSIRDLQRLVELIEKHPSEYRCKTTEEWTRVYSIYGHKISYDWTLPFVDINTYRENRTHIWTSYDFIKNIAHRKTDIFPLHLRPFEDIFVKAPRDGLKILKTKYKQMDSQTKQIEGRLDTPSESTKMYSSENFKDHLAFVRRRILPSLNGTGLMEELVIGDRVVHSIPTEELHNAVTDMFSLELVNESKS